jgi:hypothetical protein
MQVWASLSGSHNDSSEQLAEAKRKRRVLAIIIGVVGLIVAAAVTGAIVAAKRDSSDVALITTSDSGKKEDAPAPQEAIVAVQLEEEKVAQADGTKTPETEPPTGLARAFALWVSSPIAAKVGVGVTGAVLLAGLAVAIWQIVIAVDQGHQTTTEMVDKVDEGLGEKEKQLLNEQVELRTARALNQKLISSGVGLAGSVVLGLGIAAIALIAYRAFDARLKMDETNGLPPEWFKKEILRLAIFSAVTALVGTGLILTAELAIGNSSLFYLIGCVSGVALAALLCPFIPWVEWKPWKVRVMGGFDPLATSKHPDFLNEIKSKVVFGIVSVLSLVSAVVLAIVLPAMGIW